jgi:hypothetical protein
MATTTTAWGADVEALRLLSKDLHQWAAEFSESMAQLNTSIERIDWFGLDADQFRERTKKHQLGPHTVLVRALSDAGSKLKTNADDQDAVSNDSVQLPNWILDPVRRFVDSLEERKEWRDSFANQLPSLRDASPEAVQAWWNSLSDDQRAYYLKYENERLLSIRNLGADLRSEVEASYRLAQASKLPVASHTESLKVEVDVFSLHLGAGAHSTMTGFADGHYEVEVGLEGEIGAQLGQGSGTLALKGGLAWTYSFKSKAEAERFLEGLKNQFTEIDRSDVKSAIVAQGAGLVAAQVADIKRYLDGFDRTKNVGEVAIEGGVDVSIPGGPKINLKGEIGVSRDFEKNPPSTTVHAQVSAGVTGTVLPVSGDAKLGVEMDLDENGSPTSFSISAVVSGNATGQLKELMNTFAPGDSNSNLPEGVSGFRASVSANIDPRDPALQPLIKQYIEALGNNDPVGQSAALSQIVRAAEVRVSVSATSSDSKSYDVKVGEVMIESNSSQAIYVATKPSGSPSFVTQVAGGKVQ